MQNFMGNRMVPSIFVYDAEILSKMQKIDLSIRSGSFFDVSWIAESDFWNSFKITESAMKF